MEISETPSVKVLFRFFSNVLDEITVETMWAEPVDLELGHYKIDNIPFYASVACGDIVLAEFDQDEQMLTFRSIVEPSGNSTIQVVMLKESTPVKDIMNALHNIGAEYEGFRDGYFVLNISANVSYTPIKSKLGEFAEQGILDYSEPVLSSNHVY
ncbi:MAG: DUF4265 domain-containing protein [Flavobacterium sp.]|nr:MAG: DUF4265 domain-containing protein [Flavobacterium sp.]